MLLYILAGIVVLFLAFLWWRWTSVARGAQQRDARILPLIDPIVEKLAKGDEPTANEVACVASEPFARHFLYQALKHYERLDLFPSEYRSEQSQASAKLAYWMMHPNELQEAPAEMELLETVVREIDGEVCRFYVFRYRMPVGHWAGADWLLGYAGPFTDNEPPYSGLADAFSNCCDKYGEAKPEELVDWFIATVCSQSEKQGASLDEGEP